MYRHEDFTGIPRNKRRAALALKLPVWSPFERTGHHCVWSGSAAMVWFWDEDAIVVDGKALDARRFEAVADRAARVRVLPETVFFTRKPAGVHLQACREGFELQHWRADVLVDAFWFPDRPNERQLRWFVSRQENEAYAIPHRNVPEAAGVDIAPEPWSSAHTPGEWFDVNERALVASCLLVLLLAVVWQEARFWKTRHLKETVASELARMEDELGPLLDARNELLRLRRNEPGARRYFERTIAGPSHGPRGPRDPQRRGAIPGVALPATRAQSDHRRSGSGSDRLCPCP